MAVRMASLNPVELILCGAVMPSVNGFVHAVYE